MALFTEADMKNNKKKNTLGQGLNTYNQHLGD